MRHVLNWFMLYSLDCLLGEILHVLNWFMLYSMGYWLGEGRDMT